MITRLLDNGYHFYVVHCVNRESVSVSNYEHYCSLYPTVYNILFGFFRSHPMSTYFPNQNMSSFLSFLSSNDITMANNVDTSDIVYIVWGKKRIRFHDLQRLYLKTAA